MAMLTKDQTGKWVRLGHFPKRIVSLVPSITELLYHLELENQVVGITKFCVHPTHWFRTKTRVGGTKTVSVEKVADLAPDLVIANKEENVREQVLAVAASCPVYTSDVSNMAESLQMINDIGVLTGKVEAATALVQQVLASFGKIKPLSPPVKACYLIWQDPLITVGGDTFISNMMAKCGFDNVFKHKSRYPQTSLEQVMDSNCDVLLLSSEPFPFDEKHAAVFRDQISALHSGAAGFNIKVELVDGELFSWYGSRMLKVPAYFSQLQKRNDTLKSPGSGIIW